MYLVFLLGNKILDDETPDWTIICYPDKSQYLTLN